MNESGSLLEGIDFDLPMLADDAVVHADTHGYDHFFGPYQLVEMVGEGGVARVVRARHIHPRYGDRSFAIKVLHPDLSGDGRVVEYFRREAYVLALLKHENIVQTFEAGQQDGRLFIAMDYVDGADLEKFLEFCVRQDFHLPGPLVLHVIAEILKALAYAHDLCDRDNRPLHLIHRDVNPANIFLSYDGTVKLGDFGIAEIFAGRVEKSREVAGKVGYFAPEQLAGRAVDRRVDIFACGVVLFEMLSGQRLFHAADTNKTLSLNRRAKIPKLKNLQREVPREVKQVLERALAANPKKRFPDAAAMLAALAAELPPPELARMGIASVMRHLFLQQHLHAIRVNEGLAGEIGTVVARATHTVDILSVDAVARQLLWELLHAHGHRVRLHAHGASLVTQAMQTPPDLLLVDVDNAGFVPAELIDILKAFGRISRLIPPVIAFGAGLDMAPLARARAIGAADYLFKPFAEQRVLTAVNETLAQVARARAAGRRGGKRSVKGVLRNKVLLVSEAASLVAQLSASLTAQGLQVDVSPVLDEALNRTDYTSYHVVVRDALRLTPAEALFARQFRAVAGMGIVPIVYLVDDVAREEAGAKAIERCAVLARHASAAELAATIAQFRATAHAGLLFSRYTIHFEVEVRHGGRVFEAVGVDISRGGVRIFCSHIPAVGAHLGLVIRLPCGQAAVEAAGLVVRVDPPAPHQEHESLGIEFQSFVGTGEQLLIKCIRNLEERHQRSIAAEREVSPLAQL